MFDLALARRLNRPGPRYTSYPTAPHFSGAFGPEDHAAAIERSNAAGRPLSLYAHIPFCAKLCTYCGCHMMVTHRAEKVTRYVEMMEREVDLVAAMIAPGRPVVQVHWGGGTPNSLAPAEIERLMGALRARFAIAPDAEVSIEGDPRTLTDAHLAAASRAGFTRISLGVQSFSPVVQEAIGRLQPLGTVAAVASRARYEGFGGISFDLLYGLPHQTRDRFAETLAHTVALAPGRVSVFGYAHVPWMKKHQRLIDARALPGPEERLGLFAMAYEALTQAGYVPVGMDHFARPEDPLAQAALDGSLHRNFQGYTTRAGDADMIGLGVSAISDFGDAYAQNTKGLTGYYAAVTAGTLPTERGIVLSDEDLLRRHVINEVMCSFGIDKAGVEARFGVDFDRHFSDAAAPLAELEGLGVVELSDGRIQVTERGRPFVRNVAMPFDAYLGRAPGDEGRASRQPVARYSQTV
jgi:oxygen-independent coproporphyrinogen III oxidase